MMLQNTSESNIPKDRLQNGKGYLDFQQEHVRTLTNKVLSQQNLIDVKKQINEKKVQKEKIKAANLDYEKSVLLSAREPTGGGDNKKKGIKTNYSHAVKNES